MDAKSANTQQFFYRALLALARVHAVPIAHRDIKPGNILIISADFTPRLADFGLSTYADAKRASERERNRRCGTRKYFPPEFDDSKHRIADPRPGDVHSLGATFRLLLTGVDPSQIPRHNVEAADQAMQRLDKKARELIQWMTRENPTERCSPAECAKHAWFDAVRKEADQDVLRRSKVITQEMQVLGQANGGEMQQLEPQPVPEPKRTLVPIAKPQVVAAAAPVEEKKEKKKHHGLFGGLLHHHKH